jgi:hypothetical protein
MRCRWAIFIPLLFALGCQDKRQGLPPPGITTASGEPSTTTEATPTVTASKATTAPAAPSASLEGEIAGKAFRPDQLSFDGTQIGTVASFASKTDTLSLFFPGPEGEKLEGKVWQLGGKIEDPPITHSQAGRQAREDILGPDYTLNVRFTRQTRDSVEGEIDLSATEPLTVRLKGSFRAAYHGSPTAPLGPEDAPYVHGKISIQRAKKTEKLGAGYVGIGTDGKPYFNEAGFPVDVGMGGFATVPNSEKPTQQSSLASTEEAITYRHLNLPPGDYLVYVRRDSIMSAWKRIQLKESDRQTIDLTIDPATTGTVEIALPESVAKSPAETSLSLVPNKADLPALGLGSEQYFSVATVKMGETAVKVSGIPAGKYRAVRGSDEADVEVVAGKSVSVTLVPKK